jgi:hypothetical protein
MTGTAVAEWAGVSSRTIDQQFPFLDLLRKVAVAEGCARLVGFLPRDNTEWRDRRLLASSSSSTKRP